MSLSFPHFRPHPLFRGGHLQTIVGAYLPWQKLAYRATVHHVPLLDGDHIALHDDVPHSPLSPRGRGAGGEGAKNGRLSPDPCPLFST